MMLGLLGASSIKWIIAGIVTAVAITAVGLGYKYITDLQESNRVLAANVATMEVGLETERQAVTWLKGAVAEQVERTKAFERAMARLRDKSEESERQVLKLEQTFATHNLNRLAKKKPTLIEKRINVGTAAIFRKMNAASKIKGEIQ